MTLNSSWIDCTKLAVLGIFSRFQILHVLCDCYAKFCYRHISQRFENVLGSYGCSQRHIYSTNRNLRKFSGKTILCNTVLEICCFESILDADSNF